MLHSPDAAARAAHLGTYVRWESALPEWVHCVCALVAAREMDCVYVWTTHERSSRANGVREEVIQAIKHRKAPAGLTEDEALVVNFGLELLRDKHRVSKPTWDAAMKRYGLKAVTDLCVTIGYYTFLTFTLNGFEVETDADTPPTLPL